MANWPAPTITSPTPGGDPTIVQVAGANAIRVQATANLPQFWDGHWYAPLPGMIAWTLTIWNDAQNTVLRSEAQYTSDIYFDLTITDAAFYRTPVRYTLTLLCAAVDPSTGGGGEIYWLYSLATPLSAGRVKAVWPVGQPSSLYMDKGPTNPLIAGSLNSGDSADYITGVEIEVYRDPDNVTMYAPGLIGIGGTSTRSETPYAGVSLSPGMNLRWRMRHVDRDATYGAWSGWQYNTVVAESGPDNMSPISPSTKLLTTVPTLTIAHSENFDAYQWRAYRGGSEIHDSGLTAVSSTGSVNVSPPAGTFVWGDGNATPLEWEAAIHRTGSGGTLGPFSPRRGIRINTLPPTTLTVEGYTSGYISTNDPNYYSPYTDPDRVTYGENPVAKEWEIRLATVPAGTGTLVKHITDLTPAETEQLGAAFVPTQDQGYDLRVRYRDNASDKASTTMAASSSANATNIKMTAVTGFVAGDYLTLEPGTADEESRLITTVGTAGSGGTGITVDHGFTLAHTSGDAAKAFYWGAWTAWLAYTYHQPPTVAASSPADAGTVNDPTPSLVWTFTSTRAQTHAIVNIYEVVSGADNLILRVTQQGTGLSYLIPPYLLVTGKTYAWTVTAYDSVGFPGSTTRRTFTTSFTAPAQVTGATATAVAASSYVGLQWTGIYDQVVRALVPASYWRLAETSSTMTDEMGVAAGTVTGTTRGVNSLHNASDPNKAVTFSGATDYITFGDNYDFPALAPFTIAGLYKAASIGTNDRLLLAKLNSTVDGWGLRIDTDRTLEFTRGASSTFQTVNGGTALVAGTVYHVCARFDGTNLALFINGVSDATPVASAASLPGNSSNLQMGNTTSSLSGDMDDWAVWSRALTDAEVTALATAKLGWETYFDHYRVWWQDASGAWVRIDGGPESSSDGHTKLTFPLLDHFGARLGANAYRIEAHNGAQAGTYATASATLTSPARSAWAVVEKTGTTAPVFLEPDSAPRVLEVTNDETFRPPGRGSAIRLAWGSSGWSVDMTSTFLPSEGSPTRTLKSIYEAGLAAWVKAPSPYGIDPVLAEVAALSEDPQQGGLMSLSVKFEQVEDE